MSLVAVTLFTANFWKNKHQSFLQRTILSKRVAVLNTRSLIYMTSNEHAALTRCARPRHVLSSCHVGFFLFFFLFLVFKRNQFDFQPMACYVNKGHEQYTWAPKQCETDQTPTGKHGANKPKSQRSLLVIRAYTRNLNTLLLWVKSV